MLDHIVYPLISGLLVIAVVSYAAVAGWNAGVANEKRRCLRLCNAAFRKHPSDGVRLIADAVLNDRGDVKSDDEFFGRGLWKRKS